MQKIYFHVAQPRYQVNVITSGNIVSNWYFFSFIQNAVEIKIKRALSYFTEGLY